MTLTNTASTERVSDKYVADMLAHPGCKVLLGDRELRSILTELQSLRSTASVGVKGLEWSQDDVAETPFWDYFISRHADGHCRLAMTGVPSNKWVEYPTLEALYTAAQADYEGRIRSALEGQQHTICAVCQIDKHTPLRRDEMGGYVCLTCVDERLDALSAVPETEGVGEPVAWFHTLTGIIRQDKPALMMGLHEDYTPLYPSPQPAAVSAADGWVMREVARLRPEYQTNSMLDVGRRQLLDHFEKLSATPQPPQPVKVDEVMRDALTRIAEGNLGDDPWQANYERIRQVARDALTAALSHEGEAK